MRRQTAPTITRALGGAGLELGEANSTELRSSVRQQDEDLCAGGAKAARTSAPLGSAGVHDDDAPRRRVDTRHWCIPAGPELMLPPSTSDRKR